MTSPGGAASGSVEEDGECAYIFNFTIPGSDCDCTCPQCPQLPQGKTAIVPYEHDGTIDYLGLLCTEMPEARFEDVFQVWITGPLTAIPIDTKFAAVCEPNSICVVSVMPEEPALCGASVKNGHAYIKTAGSQEWPLKAVVKLSGIRRGYLRYRFPKYTKEQMEQNNKFWQAAHAT